MLRQAVPVFELLLSLQCVVTVSGLQEFFCNSVMPETIIGVTEGIIKTRNQGSEFYGNNFDCVWKIDATEQNRIQLTVESLDLGWSAQYATCSGYDNLEIREGPHENSPVLTSVCHARNPYSVISKGHQLYLRFTSTHQNFGSKRGIEIRFKFFNNVSCPPNWFQVSASSGDCFMIGYSGQADWSRAQDICNYNRANLASILSEAEFNTIFGYGKNLSATLTSAWIGLSDQGNSGSFRWIDKHRLSYKREMIGKTYNTHCVAQEFTTGKWSVLKCDSQQNYICKAKKDGSTILYQADPPSEPPDEGDSGTKLYLIVIIVIIIIVISCVAGVVFYCCFWKKYRTKQKSGSKKEREENTPQGEDRQFSALSPSAEPSAPAQENVMLHDFQMVAPPTYEESQFDPVAVSPSTY